MSKNRGLLFKQLFETILYHVFVDEPGDKTWNSFTMKRLTGKEDGKVASRSTYYRVMDDLCEAGILRREKKSYCLTEEFRNRLRAKINDWNQAAGMLKRLQF